MMPENDEVLFSQLADGELPSDQANELLLRVLDAPAEREKLREMLRLRQATAGWRRSQPARPVLIVSDQPRAARRGGLARRMGSLAVAACIGGLIVLSGLWSAGWVGSPVRPRHQWQIAPDPDAPPSVSRVTPEQMQQVAKVFALHESVAGPLAWYAADEQTIRLASADGAVEAGQQPVAVLLRLETAGGTGILPVSSSQEPGRGGRDAHGRDARTTTARREAGAATARTLVIVCRADTSAIIDLPAEKAGQTGLRVYLAPKTANGKVEMRYAVAVDGDSRQHVLASLAGQRRLGLAETSLGQLALGDRILNVEASAWALRQEKK